MEKLASRSSRLSNLYESIRDSIVSVPPFTLGYPGTLTQSSYYPGELITKEEIALISRHMSVHSILPENTRVRKVGDSSFEVLQASTVSPDQAKSLYVVDSPISVRLVPGDYAADLENVCRNLAKAAEYAANEIQRKFLTEYIESFQTGDLEAYRNSQRTWVIDKAPKVENIFGFVEPYRDPAGVRAEFEGLVAIADADETKLLLKLVENSDKFIRRLPWASTENNGKGLFEKSLFDPPGFSSIHVFVFMYNDIRQDVGFKNVIIANRMVAESTAMQWPFIDDSEVEMFQRHKYPAYYWWVVLHELLGHGTGKMMIEEPANTFNFDSADPPINPLNGEPIKIWYKPGQTWTGQFGDLATTLDECRAELVGAYLMDDPELLDIFGFTDESTIRPSDLTYNLYQQLGVDGLRALSNYNVDTMTWGQAHSRAHFAILRCLLKHGHGCIDIHHDRATTTLRVRVDRSRIVSQGKKALGEMLLRLHVYRCTANVEECKKYYEELSHVDEECLEWRKTVIENKPPPLLNVQANTYIEEGIVVLREYEPTIRGTIQRGNEDYRTVHEVHSLDDLLNHVNTLQATPSRDRQALASLNRLAPKFKFVDDFSAIIALAFGADATLTAVVWGSIRLILTLASSAGDTLQEILDMLEELSLTLPIFRIYEDTLPMSRQLETALTDDAEVICFYVRTIHFFRDHPHVLLRRNAWEKFHTDFSRTTMHIKRISSTVEKEADLAPLELRKKQLGPDDPFIASSLNNLALAYTEIGDLEEAYSTHQQAIEIRLRTKSDRIGNSYSNMASLLLRMGRLDEAAEMLGRCPSLKDFTDEIFLNTGNPRFSGDMVLLSRIRLRQGRVDDTLRLASKALAFRQRLLGNRLKTCDSLYDVACILHLQGHSASAM
ncbi:hypothetical protein Daesc_006543 [Daldinia eschscholtzii]|uniref:DUF7708 domain-containing protein n=1 Tax=Daldinia eschscholtzii TaxID=292717 RepID=A0AAX6MHW9_9PEZI